MKEEERKKAIEEREKREQARLLWYRYARRNLLSPENKPGKGSLRIGVRLPNGLKIRHFSESDSVTSLYVFVASQLIPKEYPVSEDPESPPSGFAPGETGINADNWSFKHDPQNSFAQRVQNQLAENMPVKQRSACT